VAPADPTGPADPRPSAPHHETIESWCRAYVTTESLEDKLAPPPLPSHWAEPTPGPERLTPGRPPQLQVAARSERSIPKQKLALPKWRARLFHTFLHHELQAAELMAWAVLAFPDAPRRFKAGLLAVCRDEIRHMGLYEDYLHRLGHRFGDFPVRDWFWHRVPACTTAVQYVAFMGMGLEGGNLDHTERYAAWLRDVGDLEGAAIQDRVHREEIPHVRFAVHWFKRWTGAVEFERWAAELAAPITPVMFRGRPMQRAARRAAGLDDRFLDALEQA